LCIFACVFVVREEKRARGHKGKYQKFLWKRATRFCEKAMHKMVGAHQRGWQANKCKHMERSDIKTTTSMTMWRGWEVAIYFELTKSSLGISLQFKRTTKRDVVNWLCLGK
jgi:hypothetical protein